MKRFLGVLTALLLLGWSTAFPVLAQTELRPVDVGNFNDYTGGGSSWDSGGSSWSYDSGGSSYYSGSSSGGSCCSKLRVMRRAPARYVELV